MLYRVILTKNGDYKKTIHRCKKRTTSFINFNNIKNENNVLFERKFINYNGIKPVKYKIYVVKDLEESDTPRMIRDRFGRLVEEKPIFGIWTVLADADYDIEESFWVHGFNPSTQRKNIFDIIQILMVGLNDPRRTKQIVVVHNKLLFYDEERFDMVICKNKKDAQRLHHALAKAATENKIKSLYFMGTAGKAIIGEFYEIIHENTGWSYTKIWRTTTRP
jgi:hypothetical protein